MAATAAEGGRYAQDEERARIPIEAVTAPTFDLCLARAAAGMFAGFVRPTSEAARTVRTDVELEADSRMELLVRWLEELGCERPNMASRAMFCPAWGRGNSEPITQMEVIADGRHRPVGSEGSSSG
jgi:hypothetical protein